MPTAWEDPPGCEAVIEANVRRVLIGIARSSNRRGKPTIAQANVELTSPTTTIQSGRCSSATFS